MGLFSWIQNKYYDHQLDKANQLAAGNDIDKASPIYQSLFGKQPMAMVNYSRMLENSSTSCFLMLKNLKEIEALKQYETEVNKGQYEQVLKDFVTKIDRRSVELFNAKNYANAVDLIDAIYGYLLSNDNFCARRSRYHAFFSFAKSQQLDTFRSEYQLLVKYLSEYASDGDIKIFTSELVLEKRYRRLITLLLPFAKTNQRYEQQIVENSVLVVEGNDSELKFVKSLADFCDSKIINKKTAKKLWELSQRYEQENLFDKCVKLDLIAAEFLSDDAVFNVDRCFHALAELAPRFNTGEYQQLFKLAKDLGLNEDSTNALIDRTFEIASHALPINSIIVCSLFKNEERFRTLYINNALILAKSNKSALNLAELKSVIIANTDADTIVDALAPFIAFIPEYQEYFVDVATTKIKKHSDVTMLDESWSVAASETYFQVLLCESYKGHISFAHHFAENASKYLSSPQYTTAFGEEIIKLTDTNFVLSTLETLVSKGVAMQSYYIKFVVAYVEELNASDHNLALNSINHALTILPAEITFLETKKSIIRCFIVSKEFGIANTEINSILSIDPEGVTLLAELHFAKATASKGNKAKKKELFEVLALNETYELSQTFEQSLKTTLNLLSESAEKLFEIDESEAYSICERIEPYKETWIQLYLKLRNLGFNSDSALVQRIKYQKETIDTIVEKVTDPIMIHNSLYIELWNSYMASVIAKAKSQPNEKAVLSLCQLKEELKKYCKEVFDKSHIKVTCHILQHLWSIATDSESVGEFGKAIEQYQNVINEVNSCTTLPLLWIHHAESIQPQREEMRAMSYIIKAERRTLICHLKENTVDQVLEQSIVSSLIEYVGDISGIEEDLAYRYACYLLNQTRPAEAESIIRTYLPNEKELLDICVNIFVKRAELDLQEFNDKLKLIEEGKMTSEEAKAFLSAIDSYREKVSYRLPDTQDKFTFYKKVVEDYILCAYFNEEKYAEAYSYLRIVFKNFMDDDKSFRNVAIASLRMVESGTASDENIKAAISIWITAIFTDRLFVKSLDYTQWDDEYTFTLQESLGDAEFGELPDNVNYEAPIDNKIISIKEVQNNLLNRMEIAIREKYPQLDSFFCTEKATLESLVGLKLDVKCTLIAPYISNSFEHLRTKINNAFATDLKHEYGNEEKIYALGVKYGFTDEIYVNYKKAMEIVATCEKALQSLDAQIVSRAFMDISFVFQYEELCSNLKSSVANAMAAASKAKMNYEKYFNLFYNICATLKDNTISFTFSQFMNGEVVRRLNANTLELRIGADYLFKMYKLTPSNIQVKENLQGVLGSLAEKCETGGTSADKSTLNSIIAATGNTFSAVLISAKIARIAEKLENNKMTAKSALEQVYALYLNNKSDDLVCRILAALCVRCIHEYIIGNVYGRYEVESLLDELSANKSQQFLSQAKQIAEAYDEIWSQLNTENKLLLSGQSVISLNDKGRALKAGLDYMKNLAPAGSIQSGLFGGDLGGLF